MGRSLKIPNRYEHPIIVAFLIREKHAVWNFETAKSEFRRDRLFDNELEELYYHYAQNFTSIADFCSSKEFEFFIKDKDGLQRFSSGPEICFDSIKGRIIFDKIDLYSIPKGVNSKLTQVNDLLTFMNIDSPEWDKSDWEDELLTLENIMMIEELFFIKLEIWTRKFCRREFRVLYENLYVGDKSNSNVATLHYQEESESFIVVENPIQYFDKYFACQTENCFFTFKTQKLLDEHSKLCGKEKVRIVQDELGPSEKLIKKAEERNLIPKCGFNRNFIFFDIESVLPKSQVQTKKTRVLSTHSLVSIAANR